MFEGVALSKKNLGSFPRLQLRQPKVRKEMYIYYPPYVERTTFLYPLLQIAAGLFLLNSPLYLLVKVSLTILL
jgi:hypothetical protein